jgi:hypothetical protein
MSDLLRQRGWSAPPPVIIWTDGLPRFTLTCHCSFTRSPLRLPRARVIAARRTLFEPSSGANECLGARNAGKADELLSSSARFAMTGRLMQYWAAVRAIVLIPGESRTIDEWRSCLVTVSSSRNGPNAEPSPRLHLIRLRPAQSRRLAPYKPPSLTCLEILSPTQRPRLTQYSPDSLLST